MFIFRQLTKKLVTIAEPRPTNPPLHASGSHYLCSRFLHFFSANSKSVCFTPIFICFFYLHFSFYFPCEYSVRSMYILFLHNESAANPLVLLPFVCVYFTFIFKLYFTLEYYSSSLCTFVTK